MSDDLSPLLAGFNGVARLFPLPNMVLYPHVMQPLHIFEPRYRQMTADALAGDRLIALVLLRPGWETDYANCPAVNSVACLGKIVAEQHLEDGRFNILLRGLCRVRIAGEIPHAKLYRQAQVDVLEETSGPCAQARRKLRRQLLRSVPVWLPSQKEIVEHFRKLFKSELSLGALCDIIAFALPLDMEFKQKLLEELDVEQRLRCLLHHLKERQPPQISAAPVERRFPPEFSMN